jgi:amino acid transporter
MAAGETKDPRRNIPKAVRSIYTRIILFYILGTAVIGLILPYIDPELDLATHTAASSPFVIAMNNAGIKVLPSIVNACIITFACSATSAQLYTSSRALYGLAVLRKAPRIFAKKSAKVLPWVSVLFCSLFALLSYTGIQATSSRLFGWFVNMTAIAGLMTWFSIAFIYTRFYAGLKAQGIDRNSLPFASALQPYAAWWAVGSCLFICLFSGWNIFLHGQWSTCFVNLLCIP